MTSPKGTILIECGKLLHKGGYKIKVLNTINFKKSMHYKNLVAVLPDTLTSPKLTAEWENALTEIAKGADRFHCRRFT